MLFVTVVASRGKHLVKLGIGLGFDLDQGVAIRAAKSMGECFTGVALPHLRAYEFPATSDITIYRERIQHRISALQPPGRRRPLADHSPHHS